MGKKTIKKLTLCRETLLATARGGLLLSIRGTCGSGCSQCAGMICGPTAQCHTVAGVTYCDSCADYGTCVAG
jgi:hypothetical protein